MAAMCAFCAFVMAPPNTLLVLVLLFAAPNIFLVSLERRLRARASFCTASSSCSLSLLRVKSRECNRVQKYDDDFKRKKMKRCEGTKKKKNRFARGRRGTRAKPEMCFSFDLFGSM